MIGRPRSRLARHLLFWSVLGALGAIALRGGLLAEASDTRGPWPSPRHSPADVVAFQLDALDRNDGPEQDTGIDIAYRFASPQNRYFTGPIDRFRRIVRAPAFRPMFDQKMVAYGATVRSGDVAIQPVTIEQSDGSLRSYVFQLSRQVSGPLAGCWMTDAVYPLEKEEEPGAREGIAI